MERGQTQIRTIIITVLATAAGAVTGYAVSGTNTLNLDPSDIVIILLGGSVKVTTLELRANPPDGGEVALNVYADVNTSDGGEFDLGEARCPTNDAGLGFYKLMNEAAQKKCAAGDSGVPYTKVRVHGLDFQRIGSGGVKTKAYGNYTRTDGGLAFLPGYTCGTTPTKATSIMDGDGLQCFRKEKGFVR